MCKESRIHTLHLDRGPSEGRRNHRSIVLMSTTITFCNINSWAQADVKNVPVVEWEVIWSWISKASFQHLSIYWQSQTSAAYTWANKEPFICTNSRRFTSYGSQNSSNKGYYLFAHVYKALLKIIMQNQWAFLIFPGWVRSSTIILLMALLCKRSVPYHAGIWIQPVSMHK